MFRNEFSSKPFADLIPHSAEDGKPLFIAADSRRGRIFEALMDPDRLAGKDRASLFCVVAYRDYVVKLLR
jgi:hypothetical protein